MNSFSAQNRPSIFQQCETEPLDIIIVGGGITGAGTFLDATRYGLKTALFEQNDFAGATSSASSKLIHGGLRYLEMMDFGLVFESCRERKRLLKVAPHLVEPLEFTFPVYKGQRRNLWTIYIGTWIYYLLALFRNISKPVLDNSVKTLLKSPRLNRRDLTGSVRYFDASTIDSRLTLATIKTGVAQGGYALNHAKVTNYIRENGKVCGVTVEDQITHKKINVRAKWVINAIGPWTDPSQLRLTKGVHMIVEGNPFQIDSAIDMLSPIDGRVLFVIPWCGHTLIGTTDTDFKDSPDNVRVEKKDLEYLLNSVQTYFPTVQLKKENILSTFAGLRCLRSQEASHPSDVSREHMLYSDTDGLLTVAGGKLTTYLSMGEEITRWVIDRTPDWKHKKRSRFEKLQDVMAHFTLKSPSEIKFIQLIREEMAVTVRDLLEYRTLACYLTKDHGASLIEMAARAIKTELGFSEDEIQRQVDEYKQEIEKHHVSI